MAIPKLSAVTTAILLASTASAQPESAMHTFSIGSETFLLDGRPFQIRSGEMHAARVPREYWRHRLQMVRAMGCNAVCAYLFWNQHEPRPNAFDFSGQADVAAYCRLAQEAGLWVILRPGPYACAEWDGGGLPWWLLKTPDIQLRTRDSRYLEAVRRYLRRVGAELAPLQVTRNGPIIMVQVENEYGSFGRDKEYIGVLRDYLREAGFDVPLFTCDGPGQLPNDTRDDLFCIVNFGSDPAASFKALRNVRPTGPLMCGEYYPGWFDSWGETHHVGDTPRIITELSYMLEHGQSFSIYMVHGGTSFGLTSGALCPPFSAQITSYDYDAPIDEAGRATPKYAAIRTLFSKHLLPGETLPDPPPANPVIGIPEITFAECAPLLEGLGGGRRDQRVQPMEMYEQGAGCILYRTTLPAGPAATLRIRDPHDYAQVYLDGQRIAVLDRRYTRNRVRLGPRPGAQRLDILVEALGHVHYGAYLHDRKGITEKVELLDGSGPVELTGWEVFALPLDESYLAGLKFAKVAGPCGKPAIYRAEFELAQVGDTFLDMRTWAKGAVWVNRHNLGRYWQIGPQQTLYLPGCWLNAGRNVILVLDLNGGAEKLTTRGLVTPILDQVGTDPNAPPRLRRPGQSLNLAGVNPIHEGVFAPGADWQNVRFGPADGRYLCLETLASHNGDAFATCAELRLLDPDGNDLPREQWTVAYADSEELFGDDGSAANVLDGQSDTFWHTQWSNAQPGHPHQLVLDLGAERRISGLRYLPRQDSANGRIRNYRLYLSRTAFAGF